MKNKTKIIIIVALFVLGIIAVPSGAKASLATGGLYASYSRYTYHSTTSNSGSYDEDEVFATAIENIDFSDLDGHLATNYGQATNIGIRYKGYIYIDAEDDYDFQMYISGGSMNGTSNTNGLSFGGTWLSGEEWFSNGYSTKTLSSKHLEKGWHRFYTHIRSENVTSNPDRDTSLIFRWRKSSESTYVPIPPEKMGYFYFSNAQVKIPASGKDNFYFATAGAPNGVTDTTTSIIQMDVPAAYGDWMKDEVYVFWFRSSTSSDTINITDMSGTGGTQPITGTAMNAIYNGNYKYHQLHAKVPPGLINEDGAGSRRLSLKFEVLSGDSFKSGIVIIVPYRDPSRPLGNLLLYLTNMDGYDRLAPPAVFPINGFDMNNSLDPFFIFDDGETKKNVHYGIQPCSTSPCPSPSDYHHWRVSYMTMKIGKSTDPWPDITDNLMDPSIGGSYYIPKKNNGIASNTNDPDYFFPNYGREGDQIDVLSTGYVPNHWSCGAANYYDRCPWDEYAGTEDGKLDPIPLADEDRWIAFQYVGSPYAGDGVGGDGLAHGESGSLAVIGLYSTEDFLDYPLTVNITNSGTVTSDIAGISGNIINCSAGSCTESFHYRSMVTLTAAPSADFDHWEGDCAGAGTDPVCVLFVDKALSATAAFAAPATFPGQCGPICNENSCLEPTSGFCAPTSTMENFQTTATGWSWDCKGTDGTLAPVAPGACKVERNCGWVER